MATVEPPIMDTLKSGQLPYNGQNVLPPTYIIIVHTSEEGTTSEQWTKFSFLTCPLFRGSTVAQNTMMLQSTISLLIGVHEMHGQLRECVSR